MAAVGNLGLCLLVMEGGLSIDLDTLRSVGPVAFIIAIVGTILPIALGCAFMTAVGYSATAGVAAGTALSSTSIGMATKMMQNVDQLNTPLGSLICVSAMVRERQRDLKRKTAHEKSHHHHHHHQ